MIFLPHFSSQQFKFSISYIQSHENFYLIFETSAQFTLFVPFSCGQFLCTFKLIFSLPEEMILKTLKPKTISPINFTHLKKFGHNFLLIFYGRLGSARDTGFQTHSQVCRAGLNVEPLTFGLRGKLLILFLIKKGKIMR